MALTDGEKAIIAAINKLGNVIGGKEGAEGDVSTKKDEETGEQYIARLQKEVELMSQIGGHHEANLALLSKEKELNRKLLADAAEALKLALQKGEIGKDEANEKLKELNNLKQEQRILSEEEAIHKKIEKHMSKGQMQTAKIQAHMKAMKKDAKGYMLTMTSGALDKVLAPVVKIMKEMVFGLNEAEKAFERTTGLSEEYSRGIRETYSDLRAYGVSTQEAAAAHTALAKGMTDFTMLASEQRQELADTAAVLQELGVANETFAKSSQVATKMLGVSTGEMKSVSLELTAYAKDLQVSPEALTAEFAAAGGQIAKFGKQGVKAFKDLQYISKITGLEMNKILAITNKFDTFEGAADQAGKLNAALGGNFVNAMDLMMATDPADRFNMIRDSILDAGLSFDDMSYYQKNFYKETLGLSDVGDLALMLSGNMESLTGNLNKTTREYEDMAKQAQDVQKLQDKLNSVLAAASPLIMELADAAEAVLDFFEEYPGILKSVISGLVILKLATMAASAASFALKLVTAASTLGMAASTAGKAADTGATVSLTAANLAAAGPIAAVGAVATSTGAQMLMMGGAALMVGLAVGAAAAGIALMALGFSLLDVKQMVGVGVALVVISVSLIKMTAALVALAVASKVSSVGLAILAGVMLSIGLSVFMAAAGVGLMAAGMSLLFNAIDLEKLGGLATFIYAMVATSPLIALAGTSLMSAAIGLGAYAVAIGAIGLVITAFQPSLVIFNNFVESIASLIEMSDDLELVAAKFERISESIKQIPPVTTIALTQLMSATAVATTATATPALAGGGTFGGGASKFDATIKLEGDEVRKFLEGIAITKKDVAAALRGE